MCLDSEGAQIRTGAIREGTMLANGSTVTLSVSQSYSDDAIQLTPSEALTDLEVGDLVSIDFKGALVQVIELAQTWALARVVNPGAVGATRRSQSIGMCCSGFERQRLCRDRHWPPSGRGKFCAIFRKRSGRRRRYARPDWPSREADS